MKRFFIVCDFKPEMLKLIKGNSVVFFSSNFSVLNSLRKNAEENDLHIHCVVIKNKINLSDILFEEKWDEFPLAIESPSLGRVHEFLKRTSIIRKLNVRFYLSTNKPNCYKDIRILSSLGYPTTIIIDGKTTDWQQLTELMTYGLLNTRRHAEIHPFDYISSYYHPNNRTNFASVYFNDPERYLHINKKGIVFLKREDLLSNKDPCGDLNSIETIEQQDIFKNEMNKWFEFFLKPSRCASCKGWRICLGKYVQYLDSNPGCENFFSEFIDTIEIEKKIEEKKIPAKVLWQP